jgi:hypothetical protein
MPAPAGNLSLFLRLLHVNQATLGCHFSCAPSFGGHDIARMAGATSPKAANISGERRQRDRRVAMDHEAPAIEGAQPVTKRLAFGAIDESLDLQKRVALLIE